MWKRTVKGQDVPKLRGCYYCALSVQEEVTVVMDMCLEGIIKTQYLQAQ